MPARAHLILYVSTRSESLSQPQVNAIFRQSRERNYERGIRGALLHDGQLFAQLLIGFEEELKPLASRIARDKRHRDFRVLIDDLAVKDLLFREIGSGWRAGMTLPGALTPLASAPSPLHEFLRLAQLIELK